MKYRRFRTPDGAFLDALLTCEEEFSVPAGSHQADHERGYGVAPLTVVEADSDPCVDMDETKLLHAPPRPPSPPTAAELMAAAFAALAADPNLAPATKAALAALKGG